MEIGLKEKLRRFDCFEVQEGDKLVFYVPEDFMTHAQAEAYQKHMAQVIQGLNQQIITMKPE